MAWLENFLLGRPGYEMEFDINPEAIEIEDQAIAVYHRTLSGIMKKSILNHGMPTIRIASKYLTLDQRNLISSLTMADDTFMSFQTRDDWKVSALRIKPQSLSTVLLPPMSCVRLSQKLAEGGFDGVITVSSVSTVPNPEAGELYSEGGFGDGGYSGPDYFTGGSYDDETRTITLGTSLPSMNPVYVTFTYKGWLVDIERFNHNSHGEFINWFGYDFQLTAA